MNNVIMILGGYGAFGSRIAQQLAAKGHDLMIVGRNQEKADSLVKELELANPAVKALAVCCDIKKDLKKALEQHRPKVLIHTCGPFQNQDFDVLKACIQYKVHYVDLADGRAFVKGIRQFNKKAESAGITAVTGASTVPALSSAVLAYFQSQGIHVFDAVKYGVSPGQQTDRGLATAQAVLSYVGRPIQANGKVQYGWQGIYLQKYPVVSNRLMGTCEIPDLDVLPEFYPIRNIHFSAGMESKLLHLSIWVCSGLVRMGLPLNLSKHASFWMKVSRLFDFLGSKDGGMHVIAEGKNQSGQQVKRTWFIIAKDDHGPFIPTVPAVIMASRLAQGEKTPLGVMPCVGLIDLGQYLDELSGLHITTHEQVDKT